MRLAVGDPVCGLIDIGRGGGYAELVCLPADELSVIPARLSCTKAAAVPLAG